MTAQMKLEPRDLEILRALLRVRYLTTRQMNGAFFSCPRVGRRRIHRLSEYDLIRPHTKGLREVLRYTAWRLTQRGVDAVAHAFPDEPVPDALIDRVTSGSLHHAFHREALADLYLGLTVPDHSHLAEHDLGAHRRWVADMRARADSIAWQPDGDVVLSVTTLGERTDVVPDAVVRSSGRKRRVFIELDRSTKDLGRIRQCLFRYDAVLRGTDLGGDAAVLLFVVRSAARKEHIQGLAHRLPLVVLRDVEAVEWLREQVLGIPPDGRHASEDNSIRTTARHAYVWLRRLDGVLRANGMHDTLSQAEPALMKEGQERLLALYRTLKALEDKRAQA